jgi:RNA polymerase sigma-70 factor (ECF subfamily)
MDTPGAGHLLSRVVNIGMRSLKASAIEPVAVSEHTFAQLYADNFAFVWRTLRRLGVREALLEDAAQDTFVILHRRLSDLRPDASAKAFVFGIAQRVAHDYRRSAQRKGAASLDVEREPSTSSGPFEDTAKAQGLRTLERFLASVDEDKRAVFVLTELEQMRAPEIAEALDVNLSTVYSRLRAVRQQFEAFLAAEGEDHG